MRLAQPEEEPEELVETLNVSVYPNPNQGDLTVMIVGGDEEMIYRLLVMDVQGKQVHGEALRAGQNNVHLPLAAGTYLYRIDSDDAERVQQGNVVIMQK